jgi:hypothetical protein
MFSKDLIRKDKLQSACRVCVSVCDRERNHWYRKCDVPNFKRRVVTRISKLIGRVSIAYCETLLGTSWQSAIGHLKGFRDGEIDHIIPCKAYDLSREDERLKCFNHRNLQVMSSIENQQKGNTTPPQQVLDQMADLLPEGGLRVEVPSQSTSSSPAWDEGSGTKHCSRCDMTHPCSMFSKESSSKDKLRTICKVCDRERLHLYNKGDVSTFKKRVMSRVLAKIGSAPTAYCETLLGTSWQVAVDHLKGFRDGVLDHIIPCNAYDLSREDERLKCFNYRNLQVISSIENGRKGFTLPPQQVLDQMADLLPSRSLQTE